MYTNTYDKPHLKVELSFTKIVMIIVTFVFFFVVPLQVIFYYQHKETNEQNEVISTTDTVEQITDNVAEEGKVAGVSTDSINNSSTGQDKDLLQKLGIVSESDTYLAIGICLLGIGFLLMAYMLYDHKKYQGIERS